VCVWPKNRVEQPPPLRRQSSKQIAERFFNIRYRRNLHSRHPACSRAHNILSGIIEK
jgi:hypothetical protein